jgi:hypothetical protein
MAEEFVLEFVIQQSSGSEHYAQNRIAEISLPKFLITRETRTRARAVVPPRLKKNDTKPKGSTLESNYVLIHIVECLCDAM